MVFEENQSILTHPSRKEQTEHTEKMYRFKTAIEELGTQPKNLDDLLSVRGFEVHTTEEKPLSDRLIDSLLEITKHNWQEQRPENVKQMLNTVRERFHNPNIQTYIYSFEGDPVAFISFEDQPNDTMYVSSFNVDPNLKKFGIGRTILDTIVEREAMGSTLKADVFLDFSIGSVYVNNYGFGISGIEKVSDNNDPSAYKLLLVREDTVRHFEPVGDAETYNLATDLDRFVHRIQSAGIEGQFVVKYDIDPHNPHLRTITFGTLEFDTDHFLQQPVNRPVDSGDST